MRKSRFSEKEIRRILAEHGDGARVSDLTRKHGISAQTFYRWKAKYAGESVSENERLKALEEENRQLKELVGQKELDIQELKAALRSKH